MAEALKVDSQGHATRNTGRKACRESGAAVYSRDRELVAGCSYRVSEMSTHSSAERVQIWHDGGEGGREGTLDTMRECPKPRLESMEGLELSEIVVRLGRILTPKAHG